MEGDSEVQISLKVEEIVKKIQLALQKLEKSSFYTEFMKQIQDPEMVALIKRVIGTDPVHSQLQVVLYGVGKMEPTETVKDVESHHMQLSLAILLRENFEWVNDIVVYDPVLSTVEQKAINAFDCNCLSVNENGRRKVDRPTLFFMPHCDIDLMDRVLQANWTLEKLNKIILIGNSFKSYELLESGFRYRSITEKIPVILDSDHMLHEAALPHSDISLDGGRHCSIEPLYKHCFSDISWHFFDWDGSLHGFQRQDPEMFAPDYVKSKRTAEEMINKIHLGQEKLEKSTFYRKFMQQMHDQEMVTRIENVIGEGPHHSKFQVVLHGIGVEEPNDHMHLAFAILLREKFYWVNDIAVYGPAFPSLELYEPGLSTLERIVMKALNCSLFCPSKQWSVDRPTLFFLPRSQMFQYVSIVEANWSPAKLKNVIILGESFKDYTQLFVKRESKTIMRTEQILHEIPLQQTATCADIEREGSTPANEEMSNDPDPEDITALNGLRWHFFSWDPLFDDVSREDVRSFFGWDRLHDLNPVYQVSAFDDFQLIMGGYFQSNSPPSSSTSN